MLDYLIVGLGLAGISFCEQLVKHGRSYTVISDTSQTSTLVAGGLYNPVILKRFTLAWKAKEQLAMAIPFYSDLEKKLGVKLNYPLPVYRRFASIEEQNLWFEASDKKGLAEFLSTEIHPNKNPNIDAPFGYGEVLGAGRIDTRTLVSSYMAYLIARDFFAKETFDHSELQIKADHIQYKSFKARRIVFAEGFGMKQNPFFNYLPIQGSKGEYLFIKAPDLKEKSAIKSSIFCIPEGNDIYRIGANYAREDKTNAPTDAAKRELLKKWDGFIRCDYEVVDHVAGVRPTVSDRKPLVGQHPEHHAMYVLNGFGSRGVMTGPYASERLYKSSTSDYFLDKELNLARFTGKYFQN
ncbi:NAD(P)/FAD-dependent oxidoreductase [Pricia sp.]|uniref:NAD(P)/FAD-dependent oxidoreductase n=1 Tax=Pricia sp. TaxID=2268138 RepID=UPI0035942E1D